MNNSKEFPPCPANELPKHVKDTMWHFLMMGGQKADIPGLEEAVIDLCNAAMQKNAGNREDAKRTDINWSRDLDSMMWRIIIGATALVLSGELDKIGKYEKLEKNIRKTLADLEEEGQCG